MTQYLPPNLLALFAPRAELPFLPPAQKLPHEKKTQGYQGIGGFVRAFEDPNETPPPTRIETREERQERKRRERAEQVAYKLEQDIALWDPYKNSACTTDPYKTLFIARINYDTSESKLRREFEGYGPVRKINLVHNCESGKPRGYAFIEYEHERDMHSAYKHADGKKIDGRRVLVDVERGRIVKGWLPRRLGGGLGGTRRGGPEVNVKHSGREDSRLDERYLERERERGGERGSASTGGGERDREREKRRSRSRSREHKRRSRSRSRERHRDRHKHREPRDSTRDSTRDANRDATRDSTRDSTRETSRDPERSRERSRDPERSRDGERTRDSERSRDPERSREGRGERGVEKVEPSVDGINNNGMAPPPEKSERRRRSRSRDRNRDRDRKRRRSRSRSKERKRRDRDRDRSDRGGGDREERRGEPPTPRADNDDKDERMLMENVVIKTEPLDDGYSNSNTGFDVGMGEYNYDGQINHFNFPEEGQPPEHPYVKYEPDEA